MTEPLEQRASGCVRCRLSATRQRVVVGSGRLDAPLALVGEAPGATEDQGGEPFIGRSGQLLFRALVDETGLRREQCYVTNVVKCRPPENRTPRADEISACSVWLDEQLTLMGARVIVAVGLVAARALLHRRDPLRDLRGVPHHVGERTVVATVHPAAALRGGPSVEAVLREDLRLVATLVARS